MAKRSTTITTNRQASQLVGTGKLQAITFNISSDATIRYETLEGRNYMVVPMVMITDGVHAGSRGPLYYPPEELAKTPQVWNHKPIVVYHPMMNGQAVSACEPAVISRRKVGVIMNTTYVPGSKGQPGKLKAEAWLEKDRLQEVDPRVLKAIVNRQMVEVSTGLFTDNEEETGMWKGEEYQAVARNYRPDHLAILPDEKGSCSIADGAGLLRNSRSKGATVKKSEIVDSLIANEATNWEETDREFLMEQDVATLNKIAGTGGAAATVDSGSDNNDEVEDAEGQVKAKKGGKKTGNVKCDNAKGDLKGGEEETDEEEEENEKDASATNNSAETVEDYINNAPEGMRDVLASQYNFYQRQKKNLIKSITSNKRCKFTANQLASKPLDELEQLAELAGVTTNSRPAIRLEGMEDAGAPTANAEDTSIEPLVQPTINFEKQ